MPASPHAQQRPARYAARLGFFIAGFGLAMWAPLVPYVRERIEMSDATFGLMLLCVGVGSLTFMPLSSKLAARFGIRPVALTCIAVLGLALWLIAHTHSLLTLGMALFGFGASLGVLDVVLNIQSLMIEQATKRRLMSNFHGMFSVGTIVGALVMTCLLTLSLSVQLARVLMLIVIAALSALIIKGLLSYRPSASSSSFIRPKGLVLTVGLMCFVVYLAEGAILDWSALYLVNEKAMATAHAGLGYTSFAIMVALGRFTGDRLVSRLGSMRIIVFGSVMAGAGILLSVVSPHWLLTLTGYALCGLGCANISPVLISSLSKQNTLPVADAVTAATTIGFAGVLAGPAIMGAVAHISHLSVAFVMLAALLLSLTLLSKRLP